MTSPYRIKANQVIQSAIANCLSSDPKVIKKAIRDAYPFGIRENHPYQIWLSEQKKALKELGIVNSTFTKQRKDLESLMDLSQCKWCKNSGCLICLSEGKLKLIEDEENVSSC